MPIPRKVTVRCPCGWERELDVDLDADPPVWMYECPAPGCASINTVRLVFEVETKRKPKRQWFQPRLAE